MYSTELFKIIPPNDVHKLIREKNKENFSSRELKPIERIARGVEYIMDNTNPIIKGRFSTTEPFLYLTQTSIEIRDKVVVINYVNNLICFTKLEDDYILITFGKERDFSTLATSDKAYDIRFGVLCDDIDGVLSFHKEIMTQDDFIRKIMLNEKI
jgi:hypothetical protein